MRSVSIAAIVLLGFAGTQPVFSQAGASAGIYGSVLDAQGAIIPGVRVTLQHVRTNQTRTAVTNPAGEYSFPLLPVGEYRISVEQAGFKKHQETGVLLQVNDNVFNTNLAFPFPDAVQEFSMVTSNAGMEVGRSSSGSVNIVTKSGTNQIHGDAFWYVRNTKFNANGFFSRFPDGLKRNQTGGTLGGPIIKDKLFVFGGYQRTWVRSVSGGSQDRTMPAPFRNGDFSSLLPGTVINDPLTGTPFTGNIIPKSRFSPAAQNLLQWSPLPDPDGFTRYRPFHDAGRQR